MCSGSGWNSPSGRWMCSFEGPLAQGASHSGESGVSGPPMISQSEHSWASPSGSSNPVASMCTSPGLRTTPSLSGSRIVGALGGAALATPAAVNKITAATGAGESLTDRTIERSAEPRNLPRLRRSLALVGTSDDDRAVARESLLAERASEPRSQLDDVSAHLSRHGCQRHARVVIVHVDDGHLLDQEPSIASPHEH